MVASEVLSQALFSSFEFCTNGFVDLHRGNFSTSEKYPDRLLSMMDDDSLQDSQRGVPGNIRILQEAATVATAALVASQGSAAVFQQRARRTLLEIEQDKVVMRKGDRGLPGLKVYVANRIAATQSLSSKFLGSFHLQS